MKKNILLISLYYPPIHSIASNRMESITKYLDPKIFDIDVVTLHQNNAPYTESNGNVTIYRIEDGSLVRPFRFNKKTNILFHSFKVLWNIILRNTLSEYKRWHKNALSLIRSLKKEKKYDLILSSYSPAVAHETALIAKKYLGCKWIADMRDEMSLNPFLSNMQRKKLALLEQQIFHSCDMITSVSKPILDDFKKLAGSKAEKIRFVEIRNGYDFSLQDTYPKQKKDFILSYTGSFYGNIDPSCFLKALSWLYQTDKIPPIKVKFVGISKPINIPENLVDMVDISSIVSHSKALEIMRESDVLLLIHPTNGRKGVYTGKLFEYLGMCKPIIALVDPEDVAAQLIHETNAGYIVDNSDIVGIQDVILEAYNDWKNNKIRLFDIDTISKHHRKEQAKRLEKAIMEVLS